MLNNILVIADSDTNNISALEKARAIVSTTETRVTVLGFINTKDSAVSPSVKSHQSALEQSMEKLFGDLPHTSCDVIATPDIAAFCRDYTQEYSIDLVLKTGHRSETLFYTPTDWQLIRQLKCPVIIASPQKWRPKHNIMATIDIESSNEAQRALDLKVLRWSAAWAQKYGSNLHIAHCIPIAAPLLELDIVSKDEKKIKKAGALKDKICDLIDSMGIPCESILVEAGVPDRVLPSCANRIKAELVVMGSVGRKGLKGTMLGNTAEKVMQKLRTDLAVIHPD